MSSQAPTKRERPTNSLPSKAGLRPWIATYLASTVGRKVLVALTGTFLTGFVIIHMIGNLQMFAGQEAINAYAKMLKSNPAILWGARFTLLGLLLVHLFLALALRRRASEARPTPYLHENNVQATTASLTMPQTGLLILAFVVFHIAHYTLGIMHKTPDGRSYLELVDAAGRHDVYAMVLVGFRSPWFSLIYLAAQIPLFLHLRHGVASVFQTLGLNTPRTAGATRCLGLAVAAIVTAGNVAIVLAVWSGIVK